VSELTETTLADPTSHTRTGDSACAPTADATPRLETHARPSLTEGANDRCEVAAPATSVAKRRKRCAETARCVCVQAAEVSVRTDVVCLPCAVNTCGNDSPSCHPSPCSCAASDKPPAPLLGKRDTAPRPIVLPMNAAVGNSNAAVKKRSVGSSLARRRGDSSRRAVFVQRGFCRPSLGSIQSPDSELIRTRRR